jgi:hypothetical protein
LRLADEGKGETAMPTVTEIQQAILALSEADYAKFRKWFTELDWERWDREIEADSASGKLDFLKAQALEAKEKGELRCLPTK